MKYTNRFPMHSNRNNDRFAPPKFVFDDEPVESLLGHDSPADPTPANALDLWEQGEHSHKLGNDLISQMMSKFERVEIPGRLDELIEFLRESISSISHTPEKSHELACAQYLMGRLYHRQHEQLDVADYWYRAARLTMRKTNVKGRRSLYRYLGNAVFAIQHEQGISGNPETNQEDYLYWSRMIKNPKNIKTHITRQRDRVEYALKKNHENITDGRKPQTHSALAMNELALSLCHIGELQESETLLRRALAHETLYLNPGHPKIPHRMNNLAGVLLIAGKLKPSAAINQLAWKKKQRWGHDITSARILFIRIIVEMLQKKPIDQSLGQLKTLYASNELHAEGGVVGEWDFLPRLSMVREWLEEEDFNFLATLLRTVNQVSRIPCLYQYPQWLEAKPAAL